MNIQRCEAIDVSFEWAEWTHVGKRRTLNEDALFSAPGLFAVADGMGGHGSGDVASRIAIDTLVDHGDAPFNLEEVPSILIDARTAVRQAGSADGVDAMGTTLVAALWTKWGGRNGMTIAHVGDSRCYEMGPGGLHLVTKDHSVVQELLDNGDIGPGEADRHPERHVVTQALGGGSQGLPDFVVLEPANPQRLLLCSDGVSGQITPEALEGCLSVDHGVQRAAKMIQDLILAGDAPDNATAIVIDCQWEPAVLASASADAHQTTPRSIEESVDETEKRLIEQWASLTHEPVAGDRAGESR